MRILALTLSGLIGGVLLNLPYWAWLQGEGDGWMCAFPLRWLGIGLTTMSTFFHELGHTAAFLFYGYLAVPTFDFTYGGGMAVAVTGQAIPAVVTLDLALAYGIYYYRAAWPLAACCVLLLGFSLATAFTDGHLAVIAFAGPLGQAVAGSTLLCRLTCGLTNGTATEKYAHAVIGCALIGQVLMEGFSLLHNAEYKQLYDNQKGGHDLGDFAQIADLTGWSFQAVVRAWLAAALLLLALPVAVGTARRRTF